MSDIYGMWRLATGEGARSPCAKSKRGVVIWDGDFRPLAYQSNRPPYPLTCNGSASCRASCGKVAVHAEQAALLECLESGIRVYGAEMLHTKVALVGDTWTGVAGGPPSCPDCSKLILASGIAGMWLIEMREGRATPVRYTAEEFHRLTLQNCCLHPFAKPATPG